MGYKTPHIISNPEIRQNFESLEDLLTAVNAIAIGSGKAALIEPNTAQDGVKVVHGLGIIPKFIAIQFFYADDGHQIGTSLSSVHLPTKEEFTFGFRDLSGVANKLSKAYWWIAIA